MHVNGLHSELVYFIYGSHVYHVLL